MAEILVVDDEPGTLRVLRMILKNAGHHVVCATDGVRALAILEDNPHIDILITDVVMPHLDGRELVATLQRDSARKDLPMIIMSGTVRLQEIVRLLEAGASRFLAKPISPVRLIREVDSCLASPTSRPGEKIPAS